MTNEIQTITLPFGIAFELKASINDIVTFMALAVAIFSTWLTYILSRRADLREERVEKSTAYLQLETHSSMIFQYQAAQYDAFKTVTGWDGTQEAISANDQKFELVRQFYLQCLNLFEVASNFRKKEVVDHGVYASWVAWFLEIAEQPYFQHVWPEERSNYTDDVRRIFDAGCMIYASELNAQQRQRAFYDAVAQTLVVERNSWSGVVNGLREELLWRAQEIWGWLTRRPRFGPCEEVAEWLDRCNGDDLNWVAAIIQRHGQQGTEE